MSHHVRPRGAGTRYSAIRGPKLVHRRSEAAMTASRCKRTGRSRSYLHATPIRCDGGLVAIAPRADSLCSLRVLSILTIADISARRVNICFGRSSGPRTDALPCPPLTPKPTTTSGPDPTGARKLACVDGSIGRVDKPAFIQFFYETVLDQVRHFDIHRCRGGDRHDSLHVE